MPLLTYWSLQAVQLSWGEKSEQIRNLIKCIIPVSDSYCVLEDRNLPNTEIPGTVKESRIIMKAFVVSTAEYERVVSLTNSE
jgi:hypothetical protein